jgi:hypothetical protein
VVFDTLSVPWYDFPVLQIQGSGLKPRVNVPFSPDKDWNLTPAGAMIGGVSDSYSFEIRHRDGRTLMIERAVAPVPVQPEESRWHFETLSAQMRLTDPGWIWRGPSIPDRKPAYETFIPDRSGRIWVLRKGPGMNHGDSGEWRDTYLFDVFEEQTGRYLGEVGVPPGVRFEPEPFIRDDLFIASCFDESGVPCVKGYRIVRPHRR